MTDSLTDAQRDEILNRVTAIREALPFLESLAPEEQRRLAKMGNKSRAFVADAVEAGVQNPSMLPREVDPEALRSKLEFVDQLRSVAVAVRQLDELLSDTIIVRGAEMYETARLIYQLLRIRRPTEGLDSQRQQLAQRFRAQGNRKKKETPIENTP